MNETSMHAETAPHRLVQQGQGRRGADGDGEPVLHTCGVRPRPDAHNRRGGGKVFATTATTGEAQALSGQCHDSAVAIGFKAGQSSNGGLGDEPEVAPTLSHQPSALEPTVAIAALLSQMRFIVRRLTPTECERLMGLPNGYTIPVGLDPNDPALVAEFQRIHDTFGAIMAEYAHKPAPKPKSAAQVQKWLAKITDPATCPDSPRYKVCGNGWATNQPRWILTRLLTKEGIEW